jgi:glycerol-3-phosphate dehydrogenase
MQRDLRRLADTTHDVLIVGGGIHGACAAWDAALRGLSVALVERDDFGAATSANSLRIVHGGLRYLARGDLPRMWESIRERSALLRIAPQLVRPLPVLVPTRGAGTQGRLALGAALGLNDALSLTRNRRLDATHRIPRGRLLSRRECLRLFPGFEAEDLTGGALWYDAQLRHPERLTLSFLLAAAGRGAALANYAEVERVLVEGGSARGVRARDRSTGAEFEVRARAVLIAAGPWTGTLVELAGAKPVGSLPRQAIGVNLVVGRRLADVAIGVRSRSGPNDDPVCGGQRFLFLAPQGETTLLGTWYAVDQGSDQKATVERGAEVLLREFNEACPALELTPADVVRRQWGRLPLKAGLEPGRPDALAERPRVVNHRKADGIRGLFSVEGTKFTTARRVAERVVDAICRDLGFHDPGCRTAEVPLPESESATQAGATRSEAPILRGVRDEMAATLADIAFRRTDLGAPPGPRQEQLVAAARLAGAELGWDAARQSAEVNDVMRQARMSSVIAEVAG